MKEQDWVSPGEDLRRQMHAGDKNRNSKGTKEQTL